MKQGIIDLIAAEHADFLEAIKTGRPPVVSGEEAKRSLAVIEMCYRNRRVLDLPWMEAPSHSIEKEERVH